MRFNKSWKMMLGVTLTIGSVAHARSGQAAYNEHRSDMVTAARYEPRGSVLKVTNPQTGRSIVVTVNDWGPFNGNRILDLSTGAFSALYGGLGRGVGPVTYEVISRGSGGGGMALSSRHGSYRTKSKSRKSHRYSKKRH